MTLPLAVSVLSLIVAVMIYGVVPLLLTWPGRQPANPVPVVYWWLGTGAQCLGFLAAFLARHTLPLLLVQPALTSSLAVTAVLEGKRRQQRHGVPIFFAVAALFLGLAVISLVARTGVAAPPTLALTLCVLGATALAASGVLPALANNNSVQMILAGVAFSVVAVLARTLAADPVSILTDASLAGLALLMVFAAALGQLLQTSALRQASTLVAPTATMWLIETVGPATVGLVMGNDRIRPGSWPLVALAVIVSSAAIVVLSSVPRR